MAEPAAVRQPEAIPLAVAVMSEQRWLDIAAMHECLLAILASLPEDVKPKHAVQYFKVTASKEKSQQVKCMACSSSVSSTGSNRLAKHLQQCSLVPAAVKKPFEALSRKTQCEQAHKRACDTLVKEEAEFAAREHAAKQAKLVQTGIRVGLVAYQTIDSLGPPRNSLA
jgi:hypothetical protein